MNSLCWNKGWVKEVRCNFLRKNIRFENIKKRIEVQTAYKSLKEYAAEHAKNIKESSKELKCVIL